MGKIINTEEGQFDEFLDGLKQMYSGTKKWGAVRVALKRSKCKPLNLEFDEHHKYKKSCHKQRMALRASESENASTPFSLIVKAQSPKRKITAIVGH